jgi:two-component system phosphate regulon sensor histidine kinase PhoR
MLSSNPWPAALARLLFGGAFFLLAGLVTGHLLASLLLGAASLLVYNGIQLYRLEYWLRRTRKQAPPGAEGVWGDVFEGLNRQQQRHRLRRRRLAMLLRRFRESANALPDGAIVLNEYGEMQWWNQIAARYLPLNWPQDQGQRIANLVRHPDFAAYLVRADWSEPVKIPAPQDSDRTLEIRMVPYGNDQQLLLARDVSQVHRLETMRRDFVGNISHELRTPLTVLRGMSEQMAEMALPEADALERPLGLMEQQIERMSRLVDDLLMLSRLETEAPEAEHMALDMSDLLTGIADEARTLSDGRHAITLTVDEALTIRGDRDELRSAFSNLLTNAIKYTEPGGRIDVRWFEAAGVACLAIADTGRGIAPQHLPRLTERFYRVDSGRSTRDGGTGLGLAIVKHVLSRHNARLEVNSEPGVGSTFSCIFPDPVREAQPASRADDRGA